MAVVCEHPAHRAPNTVVGILIETLQHPHNFPMVENRRSIAKRVYRPATNRSIRVGGHFQNPLPDFRNLGFQFAWAERVECFAALPRVRTVSEFKPVRDIALASSHEQQVALSRPSRTSGLSGSLPKATKQKYRLWSSGGRLAPNPCQLGRLRAAGECEISSTTPVKQTARCPPSPLPESCQCGSIAAIS